MRQRVSGLLGKPCGGTPAEHIGQLAKSGEEIDDAQTGYRTADEVIRDDGPDCGERLHEVVAIPERRPGNQDQQEARFKQESDKQQTSEQAELSFGLHFRQAIDPVCDIAIAAGFSFELDEDGQGASSFPDPFERLS